MKNIEKKENFHMSKRALILLTNQNLGVLWGTRDDIGKGATATLMGGFIDKYTGQVNLCPFRQISYFVYIFF